MDNINKLYSEFHNRRLGIHCYPNEFLVRTMLGYYPDLKLSHEYKGKNVLDWACGDGRNLILLHNLEMKLHAFEITDEICGGVCDRMNALGIGGGVEIRKGRNNQVPYEAEMFDYIVASSSLYYVDHNTSFNDNYKELVRVMRNGGYLIATLAHPETFILKDAIPLEDGHYQITDDPYGLRNGDILKVFHTKQEIIDTFSEDFENICIGMQDEDYYGMHIQLWLVVMRKR